MNEHYIIQEAHHSNTIVRINLDPFYIRTDAKRIAQAVIHFEPVFDLFMPDQDQFAPHTRRNWRDHPELGRAGLNQAQSIDLVEEISANMLPENDRFHRTLVGTHLWPGVLHTFPYNYSWSWSLDTHQLRPVEFGRLPASATPGDLIMWADLVLSFVRAAIACPFPAQLKSIASNRLGFQYFLTGKRGPTRRKRIQGVWWHVDIQTNRPVVHM